MHVTSSGEKEMFCIDIDLRDLKTAEAQLRESHNLLRNIIDTIPGRVWWKDLDSRFVGCNVRFTHDAELDDPSELIGKTDHDMIWALQADSFIADDREVIESGKAKLGIEEVQILNDGKKRWLETNKVPLRNPEGKIVGTVGTYQDVTDRKQAEAELLRLSIAIEQSPEIIVITDIQGVIQYTNPAFETITGYSRDEAMGQNPSLLKSGRHSAKFYDQLWTTLSRGQIWNGRFTNKRKDGSLYTEEAVISPVKSPDGTITNYVAVKRDIIEEIKQEKYLQQAQKMEAVGQLAGGIAHDFNNILQAILGFSDLLMITLDETQEQSRENVSEIQKAAQHAAELTRQLLAYSRKQEIQLGLVDINQTIQNSAAFINSVIGGTVEIAQQLDPDLPAAKADTQQIERVLLNLALNARDAMPDGGVLTLRTESVRFSEQDADASQNIRPGQFVCLCVSDTGTGMSKEIMDHIFEPFFTTKGVGKGTGLGLSAIYGIIQDHQGWVSVDSEPGRGTTFKVFLPADMGREAPPSPIGGSQNIPAKILGKNERILIVEDDLLLLKLSETALSRVGYIVETATTLDAAQNLFDETEQAFDLLFSDVVLSDGSGADLASRLLKKNKNLPIILCSGYAEKNIPGNKLNETDYIFLEKPFSIVKLLETARMALDRNSVE
jgi:PAS domain S-box-containing protein